MRHSEPVLAVYAHPQRPSKPQAHLKLILLTVAPSGPFLGNLPTWMDVDFALDLEQPGWCVCLCVYSRQGVMLHVYTMCAAGQENQ